MRYMDTRAAWYSNHSMALLFCNLGSYEPCGTTGMPCGDATYADTISHHALEAADGKWQGGAAGRMM